MGRFFVQRFLFLIKKSVRNSDVDQNFKIIVNDFHINLQSLRSL